MKTHLSTFLALITLLFTFSLNLQAEATYLEPGQDAAEANFTPPKWERLGMRKVNYRLDRDEIMVTAKDGRFTAVKLVVKKAPLNMHKMVIHFGNGDKQNVALRNKFAPGSESRVIDLEGGKRVIRKVVFWYDTKGLTVRKGTLILWGRH